MLKHRVWLAGLVICMALMFSGVASAWEFTMDGAYTWEYDYRTQTGKHGFFGPYDVDRGTTAAGQGAAAPLNGWVGQQMRDLVSGSDGAFNVMYMTTNMDLRINPALRIRGAYYIGEWTESGLGDNTTLGNAVASQYLNYRAPGVQRSFSPGYWNTLWLTSQTPWGTITMGKRPSTWGTGLAWNGEENRASESLALTADYGPIRIGLGFYPARRASGTTTLAEPPLGQPALGTTNVLNTTDRPSNQDYFNNDFDKNNIRLFDWVVPNVTYRSGPLDMGIMVNYGATSHRGREGKLVQSNYRDGATLPSGTTSVSTRDRYNWYGGAYLKYNNGRFFFNTEFDWNNQIDRFSGNLVQGTSTAIRASFQPVYIEAYRIMGEAGVLCGPAKVSVLYAWMNGPDRRNGRTAGINQGAFSDHITSTSTNRNPRIASQSDANTGLFRPYSLLMVYAYGLGAYINADTNNGFADDASIFAGRLDYAVAANLNVYSSFFWADRVGNGYGWGYLSPLDRDGSLTTNGQIFGFYRGTTNPVYSWGPGTSNGIRPNIPDNNLGWEVGAGCDWKLLEGLLVSSSFAYWQPGKWFNFACIDKSIQSWDTYSARQASDNISGTSRWGVNPDRSIDGIFGMELKVIANF
jgi:hypothetical protein